MRKNKKKLLSWTILIFWLVLIFCLSSQPVHKSNGLSKKITKVIVKIIEKVNPSIDLNMGRTNHYIRKSAHFFSYMILSILLMNIFKIMKVEGVEKIFLTLLICIIWAITDEIHQLFVPGRGGQLKDVFIDTGGSILGIFINRLFYRENTL